VLVAVRKGGSILGGEKASEVMVVGRAPRRQLKSRDACIAVGIILHQMDHTPEHDSTVTIKQSWCSGSHADGVSLKLQCLRHAWELCPAGVSEMCSAGRG
jgi:hypothetical protein